MFIFKHAVVFFERFSTYQSAVLVLSRFSVPYIRSQVLPGHGCMWLASLLFIETAIYNNMQTFVAFRAVSVGLLLPVIINLAGYRCFAVVSIMKPAFILMGSSLLIKLWRWLKTVARNEGNEGLGCDLETY